MDTITYEEFMKTDVYKDFIKKNSAIGKLKVMTFSAYQAIPIENVEILITKKIEDYNVIFFRGFTNISGIIDNIKLPAVPSGYNSATEEINDYTLYLVEAKHPEQEKISHTVGIFGNLKVIQYIKMIPNVNIGGQM